MTKRVESRFGGLTLVKQENLIHLRKPIVIGVFPPILMVLAILLEIIWAMRRFFIIRADFSSTSSFLAIEFVLILGCTFLIWPLKLMTRVALPCEIEITRGVSGLLINWKWLYFILIRRFIEEPIEIIINRSSHGHGDWGFQIYLASRNRKYAIMPPMAVGQSKAVTLAKGEKLANAIREVTGGIISLKGWDK